MTVTVEPTPVLKLSGIAKSYGATCAVSDATLRLRAGSVHALLGENGAGKSTLVKIIVGAIRPDDGKVTLDGRDLELLGVRQAVEAGIIPIYQHLSLFPHLSVHENLSAFSLGASSGFGARAALVPRDLCATWLAAVGLELDLNRPVGTLSLGERQLIEIARGLGQRCRVLVLDEPTAALNSDETQRLFRVVRRICTQGAAVLFITHKFDKIEDLADTVTVLRDGRTVVDGRPLVEFSRDRLVEAMLGRRFDAATRPVPDMGAPVLQARGIYASGVAGPLNVDVRAGEILGLTGLAGSGAFSIAAVLAGAERASGMLHVAGEELRAGDRARAVALGVGYVPSDRNLEGLFPVLDALSNASASCLTRHVWGGLIQHSREVDEHVPWLRRLRLHPFEPGRPMTGFSGGNQQKVLLARNLALPNLRALVLLEPTRGVDIGAREIIHDAVVAAAELGVAVVLASSDIEEILTLSHRVVVVRDGAIGAEFSRGVDHSTLLSALGSRREAA